MEELNVRADALAGRHVDDFVFLKSPGTWPRFLRVFSDGSKTDSACGC